MRRAKAWTGEFEKDIVLDLAERHSDLGRSLVQTLTRWLRPGDASPETPR